MSGETKRADILYNIDDRPPVGKSVIFAFQHILAMFAGNVTVPLLVINIVGLNSEEGTFLIQCALLVAGVATLLQVRGIKAVGSVCPSSWGPAMRFCPPWCHHLPVRHRGLPGGKFYRRSF